MHVGILGAAEVHLDGVPVDLGTRKQRALLAALALHRGRAVSADALVDLLWGATPPAAVTPTLQGYVARLRRAVEPDRAPRAEPQVLLTREDGYLLGVPPEALDAHRFEADVAAAHAVVGTGLVVRDLPPAVVARAHEQLQDALALWRGTPYAELEDAADARAERGRLEELRMVALEDRAAAALALGRHATAAGELETLTARHPLRERLWGLRALALTRSGRQAEALDVLRQVRELLAEELGLEPGAELRDLQTAVLRQDPALEWTRSDAVPDTVFDPPAPRSAPTAPVDVRATEQGWPLIGRDDQLAALVGALEQSSQGPAFAAVTGEPGIGKSRLCAELAALARADGAEVVVGRCSQDDGAPPLYPWARVLRELGHDLPSGTAEDGAARFGARDAIARTLLAEAERRHLVVVLDDLHWADASTLRVLRLVAETAERGRLLVVATWRHEPPPVGHLAETAEMLARRHALRLHLTGLSAEEAGDVVSSVAETAPTSREADALRARTDGNPFYLVEYARLARERGDLAALLGEEDPPAGVHDVVSRRLAALPEESARVLRAACVVGRDFDVPTLARVLGAGEDAVLDDLDPALEAGLVRESGVDRFRFAHALVRDTAYALLAQSRRARVHVRAAEVLAGTPGRESEVARHWLAAGPSYAGRAWRAAQVAAEAARAVYAYDEAVELLTGAVVAADADPEAGDEERYAVLLDLARAHRQVDDLVSLREVVHGLLDVAERLDDAQGVVDRQLRAAGLLLTKVLWQSGVYGVVDHRVGDTLRRCLDRLPTADDPQRCRAMIGLAAEIYYDSSVQERTALCHEALAMARRLGDRRLLLDTLLAVPLGLWSPASAEMRLELTAEAIEVARELGDDDSLATALALRATAASECGRAAQVLDLVAEGRAQAVSSRALFAQLFLDGIEVPWRAMRGELELLPGLLARMTAMHERIDVEQTGDALVGALLMQCLWGDRQEELAGYVPFIAEVRVMPIVGAHAAVLARLGRLEEAREVLGRGPLEMSPDWWFSLLSLSLTAEAAMATGLRDVAASAYAALAPYAGRPAVGGSGTCVGVVDSFLAMAAHATGERGLATRHADDAVRLYAAWELPLAGSWFEGVRRREGF